MSMKSNSKERRIFNKEEKLAILKEAEELGVRATLDKYDIYPGTYYYWKRQLFTSQDSASERQVLKSQSQTIKRLEKENQQLKILLAEKELESKLKDELLKKKYPEWNGKV